MSLARLAWKFLQREGATRAARRAAIETLSAASLASSRAAARFAAQDLEDLNTDEREALGRNEALRDLHANQRCFIVLNGPSLAAQNIEPLSQEITITANGFFKHPVVEKWQPTYHCLCDPAYFDGSEAMEVFLQTMLQRLTTSRFVVSAAALRGHAHIFNESRSYFVALRGKLKDGLTEFPDLTRSLPAAENVAQLALMTALHMGCNPIYLLGADHDWLAHRGADRHFYAGKTVESQPGKGHELSSYPYKALITSALALWEGYEAIEKAARSRDIHVLNASDGGFLDVFSRITLAEALARP